MDRRYEAFKELSLAEKMQHGVWLAEDEAHKKAAAFSHLMIEGKQTEFWQAVKVEIDRQIHLEELRFLDRLAPSYEVYLQAYSRRQALIAVLAIPETAKGEHP